MWNSQIWSQALTPLNSLAERVLHLRSRFSETEQLRSGVHGAVLSIEELERLQRLREQNIARKAQFVIGVDQFVATGPIATGPIGWTSFTIPPIQLTLEQSFAMLCILQESIDRLKGVYG